jgi:hypothetical protein
MTRAAVNPAGRGLARRGTYPPPLQKHQCGKPIALS